MRTRNVATVVADYTVADCPPADILVIPGVETRCLGPAYPLGKFILEPVCNGVFANAGLLDGLEATTQRIMIGFLRKAAPKDALKEYEALAASRPSDPVVRARLGTCCSSRTGPGGRRRAHVRAPARLRRRSRIARAHAMPAHRAEELAALRLIEAEGNAELANVLADPAFGKLGSDPELTSFRERAASSRAAKPR